MNFSFQIWHIGKGLVEKCKRLDVYHLSYFRIIVDIKDITYFDANFLFILVRMKWNYDKEYQDITF